MYYKYLTILAVKGNLFYTMVLYTNMIHYGFWACALNLT